MSVKQIAKGTALIVLMNVVRILVQLFSVPVIARFLTPVDYGLAAMAMPVIFFVMMIADAGLGASLIRTGKSDQPAWHTCFWLSASLGIVLASCMALLSPVVGFLLNEPRVIPLITTLAGIVALQTFSIVPGAALQQQRRFGTIAATESVALGASIGTAVVCAVEGLGVWALIWQQLVLYAVRLTLTLMCSPYRPRLIFHFEEAREHVLFGWHILGINLIGFVSRSLENLVIGKIYGAGIVGIYAMAFQFARLPIMLVTGPLQYVMYPHVAAIREDKAKIASLFLLLTRVVATVILPSVGLVAVASEPIFHLLLSKTWSQAIPIFVVISPAAAWQPVTAIVGTFAMALGRTDVQKRLAMQFAAAWLIGLMLSVGYGIEAVAATYSICAVVFALWSLRVCLPLVSCSLTLYGRVVLLPMTLTACAILLYRMVSSTAPEHEVFSACLAGALATIASTIALIAQRRELSAALSLQPSRRIDLA
jgi:O-antigen/teichoic acid export membrane protein